VIQIVYFECDVTKLSKNFVYLLTTIVNIDIRPIYRLLLM